MLKKTKGFIMGFLVAGLLFGGVVLASPITRDITITYRDIQIVVEGELITPRDAEGNVVEPFIYGGTTFLPFRAVAEALGQEVNWDESTNTVYIGKAAAPTQPASIEDFVGSWYWQGHLYYRFDADGRGIIWPGTETEQNIRWEIDNGVLLICTTPELCGTTCILPTKWHYTFEDGDLILIGMMAFVYTRG